MIGFGLRLSKSSLAHLIVYSTAGLYHTDWLLHRDRRRASGTSGKEGPDEVTIQDPGPRELHRL